MHTYIHTTYIHPSFVPPRHVEDGSNSEEEALEGGSHPGTEDNSRKATAVKRGAARGRANTTGAGDPPLSALVDILLVLYCFTCRAL
jgi:hypothetical protein